MKFLVVIGLTALLAPFALTDSPDNGEIYRAVVGFYSICCGPDPEDEEVVREFVKAFEKKYRVSLAVKDSYARGPEGEWAMCFKLDEVDEEVQIEFIDGIRTALERLRPGKNPNRDGGVGIDENVRCY